MKYIASYSTYVVYCTVVSNCVTMVACTFENLNVDSLITHYLEFSSDCRERALEEAANRPIFSGGQVQRSIDPSELYPHVYDSLAKAKLTSAFLAGAKV